MFSSEVFILVSCTVLVAVQPGLCSEIIGGKEVKPHSMPYMALLKKASCGGTLIDPRWVLTAAHCKKMTKEYVYLGVHSIKKTKHVQKLQVVKNIQHPKYNKHTKVNDLRLLKLKSAAKETTTVKWLPLGTMVEEPKAGSRCLVAGWGRTNEHVRKMSDVLMSVNVTLVDRTECSKSYQTKITEEMICAGSQKADACQGDSGGPLLCNGDLIGVTSFGRRCGIFPGVYAYLTKDHRNWIQEKIKTSEVQE